MDNNKLKEIFFNRAEVEDAERVICDNCFEHEVFYLRVPVIVPVHLLPGFVNTLLYVAHCKNTISHCLAVNFIICHYYPLSFSYSA